MVVVETSIIVTVGLGWGITTGDELRTLFWQSLGESGYDVRILFSNNGREGNLEKFFFSLGAKKIGKIDFLVFFFFFFFWKKKKKIYLALDKKINYLPYTTAPSAFIQPNATIINLTKYVGLHET